MSAASRPTSPSSPTFWPTPPSGPGRATPSSLTRLPSSSTSTWAATVPPSCSSTSPRYRWITPPLSGPSSTFPASRPTSTPRPSAPASSSFWMRRGQRRCGTGCWDRRSCSSPTPPCGTPTSPSSPPGCAPATCSRPPRARQRSSTTASPWRCGAAPPSTWPTASSMSPPGSGCACCGRRSPTSPSRCSCGGPTP